MRAVETLRVIFLDLGAAGTAFERLEDLLGPIELFRPPELRRCKEFRRAWARKERGQIGIRPEDVALYCRCTECGEIRARLKLEQPLGDTPPAPPTEELLARLLLRIQRATLKDEDPFDRT
ncbi:MAG: hypothetical protein HYV07_00345 [Deltaproteobacteria bacterium]|nr:hypothetical protein [Deltaproteobacteria bacterium]